MLEMNGTELILTGVFKNDTCEAIVATVKYDIVNQTTSVLSEIPFCDRKVIKMNVVSKLDGGLFIYVAWRDYIHEHFILELDSEYGLALFLDDLFFDNLSADFLGKGYILHETGLCNFYDLGFNYRKQRYNVEKGKNAINQSFLRLNNYLGIENFGDSFLDGQYGQHLRLVDSNLRVQKHVVIPPFTNFPYGEYRSPLFGGIDKINDSLLWVTGNNNLSYNQSYASHFSISQVTTDLEILCTAYAGFDAYYEIHGIRATDDGGALVYGTKLNSTYDPYVQKIGPGCELGTTSISKPNPLNPEIVIYPNPGVDEIHFQLEGVALEGLRMELMDPLGRIVYSQEDLQSVVYVPEISSGLYFYKIIQEKQVLGSGVWVKE
jgi:hypothetical protein